MHLMCCFVGHFELFFHATGLRELVIVLASSIPVTWQVHAERIPRQIRVNFWVSLNSDGGTLALIWLPFGSQFVNSLNFTYLPLIHGK